MMAAISAVIGVKEHTYEFRWSSHEHTALSKFRLGAYGVMLAISTLLLRPFGGVRRFSVYGC